MHRLRSLHLYDGDIDIMSCCKEIIDASEQLTPCECAAAGYCARHKMEKVPHFHKLCKTHIGYYNEYEQGRGPGQNVPQRPWFLRPVGLGDVVAWVIRIGTFGRVVPCSGCDSRKAWLNRHFPLWPIRWPRGRG